MTAVVITPFMPADQAGVAALITQIQQAEFGIPIAYEDQPDLQDPAGFFRKGCGEFWVARAGDSVIGMIALIDIGEGRGALRNMFVHRAWRGGAHGVAGHLLAALLDHARRAALREIFLGTPAQFVAAHRFYEKHGFVEVSAAMLPPRFPRMAPDVKFYRLALAPI